MFNLMDFMKWDGVTSLDGKAVLCWSKSSGYKARLRVVKYLTKKGKTAEAVIQVIWEAE